jgi:serine/threonine protein kinase
MYDMKSENHRESEHVTKSKNENGAIYPVVVVEAADSEYPDLKQFMEDCPRQGPIPLDLVYDFICDIADGLTALHNFGVVHGDIKPENILLFENVKKGRPVLKICDFGSTQVDVVSTDGIRGATEAWLAPEFYLFRKEVHKPTVDVFSFGLVSCYLASGGMMPDKFSGRWRRVIEDCYSTIPLSRLEPLFNILEHALKPKPDERLPTLLDISTHLLSRYAQTEKENANTT